METGQDPVVFTLDHLAAVAGDLLQRFSGTTVFALRGDLGAGKTTLIAAVCHALGVTDTVSSPTFALVNEYAAPSGPVFHLDLYRLAGKEEAIRAGLEDCLYSDAICFVEWPDRALEILPPGTVFLQLDTIDAATRQLSFRLS